MTEIRIQIRSVTAITSKTGTPNLHVIEPIANYDGCSTFVSLSDTLSEINKEENQRKKGQNSVLS